MSARDRQAGFSLIELLVVMVVFAIIIIAASQSFVPLISQTKQQSKIAVSNIEGMLGLEVMRRDIAHAGYGLYWSFDPKSAPPAPAYAEVDVAADANGSPLNDAPNGSPRAIVIGGGRGLNGSDRLAVKSVNVAANQLSERWAYLYASPTITVSSWTPTSENVGANEYTVVVRPDQTNRYLMFTTASQTAYVQFKDVAANYDPGTTSLVFSLGTTNVPKMPFNRADYVVHGTAEGYDVPARCAPGTGVLFKKVVNHASNGFLAALPLLDCVADMQVAYRFDSNADGYADTVADATADQPVTAAAARQIREVRVYILAQEGGVDRSFTYPNATVTVGETGGPYGSFGRVFNMSTITNWQSYRWKVFTLVIEPICLIDWTVTP